MNFASDALSLPVATSGLVPRIAAQALLEGGIAVMVVRRRADGEAELLFVNEAFSRLTGYTQADAVGQSCGFLDGPETSIEATEALASAFATDTMCDVELVNYRRDGSRFWNGVTLCPAGAPGGSGHFIVMMRDVSARRRADDRMAALADRLRELAMADPLTGIANRRAFDAVLDREWRRAERSRTWITLAMIDIDHFKSFNDNFGHPAGDVCLRSIAHSLRGVVRRPADYLARYGGEEFAVLLPDLDGAGAAIMGQRLVEAVRAAQIAHPCHPHGRISISCGIVSALATGATLDQAAFVEAADAALYRAKEAGRDRVHQRVIGPPAG